METLQLISNALRSGFAFTQAVEMAAKQVQSPMQDELNRFLQDSALGARTDPAALALQALPKVGNGEVRDAVLALALDQQVEAMPSSLTTQSAR